MSSKRGRWSAWMPLAEGLDVLRRLHGLGLLASGRPRHECQRRSACHLVKPRPRQGQWNRPDSKCFGRDTKGGKEDE